MGNRSGLLVLLIGFLILTVLFTGCSDTSSPGDSTITVPATANSAKFVTGDIISKTSASTDTFILVIRYDAATDKYERAFAYKKADGGLYRKDEKTDLLARSSLEKLYPEKVSHVSSLSEVPIVTPTTATTVPTTTVTTTTTTSYPAPTVSSITPSTGSAGTTIVISSISGTNFRPGATVKLINGTTSTAIFGTSAVAQSASNITCSFTISSSAIAGTWNVTVTNPDGKTGTLANAFTIANTTTTTTTTTTLPTPVVSGILPSSGITGRQISITNLAGSNLLNVTSVALTKSGYSDITATNVTVISSSQVTCTINLAGATTGSWNVLVSNSAGQSGIGTNLFTVNPVPPVAAFSASNTTGPAPLIVLFTDTSTGGTPTTWSWTFGNGNTAATQSPVTTYNSTGSYSVTLTVTNAGGSNTTTQTNYITVT